MPTPITGAVLGLTINAVDRSAITKSVMLTPQETRTTNYYIGGTQTNYQNSITHTLDVVLSSDIDKATPGFIEYIYEASRTAPNTAINFTVTDNQVTFTGTLMPVRPPVGGEAVSEQETTLSFPVVSLNAPGWS